MNRFDGRTFKRKLVLAVGGYAAATLAVANLMALFPLARTRPLPVKWVIAFAQLPPLIYLIWLLARRILHADELEQRTHLIGLSVAAVTVSVLSLIGGFLVAANVLAPGVGAIMLAQVFWILLLTYAAARWWVARRYGSNLISDERSGTYPLHAVFFSTAGLLAIALAIVAAWAFFTSANRITNADSIQLGLLTCIAAVLTLAGSFAAVRRRMRGRERRE